MTNWLFGVQITQGFPKRAVGIHIFITTAILLFIEGDGCHINPCFYTMQRTYEQVSLHVQYRKEFPMVYTIIIVLIVLFLLGFLR